MAEKSVVSRRRAPAPSPATSSFFAETSAPKTAAKRSTAQSAKKPAAGAARKPAAKPARVTKGSVGVDRLIERVDGRKLRRVQIYFDADVARRLKIACAERDLDLSKFVNDEMDRVLSKVGL